MRDLLKWGADWLSNMSASYETPLQVGLDLSTLYDINGALVDEEGRVLPGSTKLYTEYTAFAFETESLLEHFTFTECKTLIIIYDDQQYNANKANYNDVYRKKIIVKAKHVIISSS